jgi:hypothetical protein
MLFCLDTAEAGGNLDFFPGTVPATCPLIPARVPLSDIGVFEGFGTKFVSRRACPTPDRVHICPAQSFIIPSGPLIGSLGINLQNIHAYAPGEQFVQPDGRKLDDLVLEGFCPGGTTVFNRVELPPRPPHQSGSMFPGNRFDNGQSCFPFCNGLQGDVNRALAGSGASFGSFGNSFAWGN